MINEDLTKKIIKCAYTVHNTLGSGFLKKVYENALSIELKKAGYKVQTQYPISVYYDDEVLVEFYADVLVEDVIILELKAVSEISKIHEVQLVNYLKATGNDLGLLINFGESVQVKRKYKNRQDSQDFTR